MSERINELVSRLENSRPESWDKIPDIDLYMDQVIGYMKRQHIGLECEGEETLTPAMINNYMKSSLLPRAHGKKYDREHIGYLTASSSASFVAVSLSLQPLILSATRKYSSSIALS